MRRALDDLRHTAEEVNQPSVAVGTAGVLGADVEDPVVPDGVDLLLCLFVLTALNRKVKSVSRRRRIRTGRARSRGRLRSGLRGSSLHLEQTTDEVDNPPVAVVVAEVGEGDGSLLGLPERVELDVVRLSGGPDRRHRGIGGGAGHGDY